MTEHEIFFAAIEIGDAQQRAEFLAQACEGQPDLRSRVEILLAAHDQSGEFMQVPALRQMATPPENQEPGIETSQLPAVRPDSDLSFLAPSSQSGSLGRLMHYEIREVIGRGGCGIVLRAFDEKLERIVAIKVMAPELAATSPARKRFLREARATAAVRHENVVSVHAVEEQPLPFLVMEYIDGETLQERIDRTGPLDVQEVLRIGQRIAQGLVAAHAKGLIHRDIKPGNILLENGTDRLKITDFGLARSADDASLTQSGVIAGTPLYMSPEQAMGRDIDQRSDLFSLGSVLYVMCSGRPPFRAATSIAVLRRVVEEQPRPIQSIIPEVPAWLSALIARLHAKDPNERFGSAQEVADLLGRCRSELEQHGRVESLDNLLPMTPPPSSEPKVEPAPTSQSARSSSRKWMAAAATIFVLLTGLGLSEATGVTNVRGTVIRLFSPEGTLVLEVDDPGVSVSLDGQEIVITGAGVKEIRLEPGQYKLLASKDGKLVSQELVTVTRNGRQVVRVSREGAPAVEQPPSTSPVAKQRQILEWVLSIGGEITLIADGNPSVLLKLKPGDTLPAEGFTVRHLSLYGVKDVARSVAKLSAVLTMGTINLNGTDISDREVEVLAGLSTFQHTQAWYLGRTHVTDAALKRLSQLPDFRGGDFDWTAITDAGLKHLAAVAIQTLNLSHTAVTNTGLESLADPAHWRTFPYLNVQKTKVTEAGVKKLARAVPHLRIVWDGGVIEPTKIAEPDPFTPEQRDALEWVLSVGGQLNLSVNGEGALLKRGDALPSTEFVVGNLSLKGVKDIAGLVEKLSAVPPVQHTILLTDTGVGDREIAALAALPAFHRTAYWDLGGTQVTDAALKALSQLPNLHGGAFDRTAVTDVGVKYLAASDNLMHLSLSETAVTDAGLESLAAPKWWNSLAVKKTKITEAGVKKLAKAIPQLRIQWDGGVIEPMKIADPDRRAAEYVISIGGTVEVFYAGKRKLANAAEQLPAEAFRLIDVRLYGNPLVTDEGLAHFNGCADITKLNLAATQVGEQGLAHFKNCKNLTSLVLGGPRINDAALAHFKDCKKLADLAINSSAVTDAGIACFQDCQDLWSLGLTCRMSDAGLAQFKDCQNLTRLYLSGPLTDAGLAHFQNCKKLKELSLYGSGNVGDGGLNWWSACKDLDVLGLGQTRVSDAGLVHVARCTSVTRLDLRGTRVTDAGLAALAAMPRLMHLQLQQAKVTGAAVKKLVAALPQCRIEWDGGVIEPTAAAEPLSPLALVQRPERIAGLKSWSVEPRYPCAGMRAVRHSPDGRLLATAGDDGVIFLIDPANGKVVRQLLGHEGQIPSLAWSPDGKILASGSEDATVRLWEAETGRLLRTLREHVGGVMTLTWSADGQMLAAGGLRVTLWDMPTGKRRAALATDNGLVRSIAFSPSGHTLAATNKNDKTVQLWNLDAGKVVRVLEGHTLEPGPLAWSTDGKLIACGGYDSTVRVWEAATGKLLDTVEGFAGGLHDVACSPDGLLAACCNTSTLVWDLQKRKQIHKLVQAGGLSWSPDGKTLALGGELLSLWDRASAQYFMTPLFPRVYASNITGVSWSPKGDRFACSHDNGQLQIWDADSCQRLLTGSHELAPNVFHYMAWSPDGKYLATPGGIKPTSGAARVLVWDAATGKVLHSPISSGGEIHSLAWAPDGKTLVCGSHNNIMLWDAVAGKPGLLIETGVSSISWSLDGKTLVGVPIDQNDKAIRCWNAATGKLVSSTETKAISSPTIRWSPDGRRFASRAPGNYFITWWNTDTGEQTQMLRGHVGYIPCYTWSPDGKRFASGGTDGTVRLWDGLNGRPLHTLTGHAGPVAGVAWSPDGKSLLSGDQNGMLKMWDAATGTLKSSTLSLAGDAIVTVDADGRYHGTPNVERELVYVTVTDAGTRERLTPAEFDAKYRPTRAADADPVPSDILASPDYEWSAPVNLGATINSDKQDGQPSISADQLCLMFVSSRNGNHRLYESRRKNTSAAWSEPAELPDLNGNGPSLSADGLTLLFSTTGEHGREDLFSVRRKNRETNWEKPVDLGPTVNSAANDRAPALSLDGLTVYFSSDRDGGRGGEDLWMCRRERLDAAFEKPVNLGPAINSADAEADPCPSADGRHLIFVRRANDHSQLHIATHGDDGSWMTQPIELSGDLHIREPALSLGGSTLYFETDRLNGQGLSDLWFSFRRLKKPAAANAASGTATPSRQ